MDFAPQVVLGGGIALSSSAFVLVKVDKNQLETESLEGLLFGVLLLQDLAVVPFVTDPLLKAEGLGEAIGESRRSSQSWPCSRTSWKVC
jgi:predicted Kef-type K+ transport protein